LPQAQEKSRASYSKSTRNEKGGEGACDAEDESDFRGLRIEQLGGTILVDIGAELARALNKELLIDHYFREFHPHWPILHQDTFQSKSQPVGLVEAVMVAGLWTTEIAETRHLAESLHDHLDYRMREYLVCETFHGVSNYR
jgi:hypothetical protein